MNFVVKFISLFLFFYVGTIIWIGLAAPGKYYSPFIDRYLDYVSGIKILLMKGTKILLAIAGFQTQIEPAYTIRIVHGRGVVIAMDCVGYGVYSFWLAFVIANAAAFTKKMKWIVFGLLLLLVINITRISLFLLAINKNWPMPLNIDHHTWFDIFAYIAIFTMIYFFDKNLKSDKTKAVHAS